MSLPARDAHRGPSGRGWRAWVANPAYTACRVIHSRPLTVFSVTLAVLLGLSLVCLVSGLLRFTDDTEHDWSIPSVASSQSYDALTHARSMSDRMPGVDGVPERTEESPTVLFMYDWADGRQEDMFTPVALQQMCRVERILLGQPNYSDYCMLPPNGTRTCLPPVRSLMYRFYGEAWRDCPLLPDARVRAVADALYAAVQDPDTRLAVGSFMSGDVLQRGFSVRTRSIVPLGAPRPGHRDVTDRWLQQQSELQEFLKPVQAQLFDHFGMRGSVFRSAYTAEAHTEDLRVRFYSYMFQDTEFEHLLNSDLVWTVFSVLFVYAFITFHTKSVFLATVGMLQIVLSLPVAFFIYRLIFQISYFTQLHMLVIFLVLGVGADDIFVFTDAWKQSALHPLARHSEFDRLLFSYRRAAASIFSTSSTTAVAFIATAISPIMPISSFGVYAATAIVLNYLFVITLTPATVLLWHRHIAHRPWCWCLRRSAGRDDRLAKVVATRHGDTGASNVDESNAASGTDKGWTTDAAKPGTSNASSDSSNSPADSEASGSKRSKRSQRSGSDDMPTEKVAEESEAGDVDGAAAAPAACLAAASAASAGTSSDANGVTSADAAAAASSAALATGLDADHDSDGFVEVVVSDDKEQEADSTVQPVKAVSPPPAKPSKERAHEPPVAVESSPVEPKRPSWGTRFISHYYVPCLLYPVRVGRFTIRPVPLALLVLFAAYTAQAFVFAAQLRPPTSQEQWFASNHMFTGLLDYNRDNFMSGSRTAHVPMSIVFGISGIDRSGFNRWEPAENRGTPIYDPAFDLSTAAAQQAFLDTCQQLRAEPCSLPGCSGGFGLLALPGSVDCWLEDMQAWHEERTGSATLPTGAAFVPLVQQFRLTDLKYLDNVGVVGGQLKFAALEFTSTLQLLQSSSISFAVYKKLDDFVVQRQAQHPPELRTMLHSGGWSLVWMHTERALVYSMFVGLAISFPAAFLVLLFATHNIVLAVMATGTIGAIVGCVLGFCHLLGWELGVAESISAVIVVGFSVDYTVHLAHMYERSPEKSREGRTRYAAETMGVTVVAGAMTTFGAGAFMWACQMTFFTKMATLICMTIVFSVLFSLGAFMSMCALLGPQGDFGNVLAMWRALKRACGCKADSDGVVEAGASEAPEGMADAERGGAQKMGEKGAEATDEQRSEQRDEQRSEEQL